MHFRRKAFTLIELLVVIAIIAILAVVVVLTLNPAQLLAQSRDANRVSDMATLNSAINLYSTDQSGASSYSLGSTSTAYLSLPASTTNCTALGIATSGYSYACSNASNYRNASSSGWLPINFQNISSGAPFGSLPVDPTNQSSSNLYYSYETNGSQYVLSSFMESQKYAKNMQTTGGIDPALYEIGSGASTLPNASRGLVGYWPLNEGTGNTAIDWSGNGLGMTWYGTQSGTNGYYTTANNTGKAWQWAGAFDGTDDYVASAAVRPPIKSATYVVWFYPSVVSAQPIIYSQGSYNTDFVAINASGNLVFHSDGLGDILPANDPVTVNAWNFAALTIDGAGNKSLYLNGALVGTGVPYTYTPSLNTLAFATTTGGCNLPGGGCGWFHGIISDVRIYNRTLSAAEVQELYYAER